MLPCCKAIFSTVFRWPCLLPLGANGDGFRMVNATNMDNLLRAVRSYVPHPASSFAQRSDCSHGRDCPIVMKVGTKAKWFIGVLLHIIPVEFDTQTGPFAQ